jgi:methionyl-tRNA formyltransferase
MMGTGAFALPTLRALHESEHEVVGVVTQPDRRGEGHHEHVNPVKEWSVEHGLPVAQPESINAPDALEIVRKARADLCVTAAYGQILSPDVLAIPRLGVINVHASLLPKYRGAAPIAYAILHGEKTTGVTLFRMEPRLDAGPILGQVETEIGPEETTGELEARLAELAVPLTLRVVGEIESGTERPVGQDASKATRAPRLKKTAGAIDWTKSAVEIHRHCRAMQPWPTAYTFLFQGGHDPLRLIVLEARPCEPGSASAKDTAAQPGTVLAADGARLVVKTGAGAIEIARVQPAGKRAMDIADFLRGRPVRPGDRLGPLHDSNASSSK